MSQRSVRLAARRSALVAQAVRRTAGVLSKKQQERAELVCGASCSRCLYYRGGDGVGVGEVDRLGS
jgi:hypothetical protein